MIITAVIIMAESRLMVMAVAVVTAIISITILEVMI